MGIVRDAAPVQSFVPLVILMPAIVVGKLKANLTQKHQGTEWDVVACKNAWWTNQSLGKDFSSFWPQRF